jgi:hypothetical protein
MDDLLTIFSPRFRYQQRIKDRSLVTIADVRHAASRPGHVQRQLSQTGGRAPQVSQGGRQAMVILLPARRQLAVLRGPHDSLPHVIAWLQRR